MNRVMVYGTLRQDMPNNPRFLQEAEYVGEGRIQRFEMLSLGPFPCVFPEAGDEQSVVVEEYVVSDEEMRGLDRLEGYPHFYNRTQFKSPVSGEWAWIYHMLIQEREGYSHNEPVPTGDWVKHVTGETGCAA